MENRTGEVNVGGIRKHDASGASIQDDDRTVRRHFLLRSVASLAAHVLFVVSVALVCFGLFSYIENESVLAVFLTGRDSRISLDDIHAVDWSDSGTEPTPAPILKDRAVIRDGAPLLIPFFYVGDTIGVLRFPSIDHVVNVLQGDRESELSKGAGHYLSSYFPGQGNNILVAGHRTSHFRPLEHVKEGETVVFETTYGVFRYRIDEIRIIDGTDHSIGANTPEERLTIYTCYPFRFIGNAPQRYVLFCSLTGSEIYQ